MSFWQKVRQRKIEINDIIKNLTQNKENKQNLELNQFNIDEFPGIQKKPEDILEDFDKMAENFKKISKHFQEKTAQNENLKEQIREKDDEIAIMNQENEEIIYSLNNDLNEKLLIIECLEKKLNVIKNKEDKNNIKENPLSIFLASLKKNLDFELENEDMRKNMENVNKKLFEIVNLDNFEDFQKKGIYFKIDEKESEIQRRNKLENEFFDRLKEAKVKKLENEVKIWKNLFQKTMEKRKLKENNLEFATFNKNQSEDLISTVESNNKISVKGSICDLPEVDDDDANKKNILKSFKDLSECFSI